MIVLNLVCSVGHTFEGWFASSDAFEGQIAEGRVNCPHCNDSDVSRLPSGAHIRKPVPSGIGNIDEASAVASLLDQIRQLGDLSEDVGSRFPEEARRIHYKEAAPRNIKGQASPSETRELLEEGVPVLPVLPKKHTH